MPDALAQVQEFYTQPYLQEEWPWRQWSAHPRVQRAIRRRLSGCPRTTLAQRLRRLLPEWGLELPAARVASLGCGAGSHDRRLYRNGLATSLVGYDISPHSLEMAAKTALHSGITTFRYEQADLNVVELEPGTFDFVYAEMSLHHVERLERVYEEIARALVPGGLLILDEFVGPTRFAWTETQMATINSLLNRLPKELRRSPEGAAKPLVVRLPEQHFQQTDPSESIRSGEVLACLEQRFEILWRQDYGGALLHPLLHDIAWCFAEGDLQAEDWLDEFIGLEEQMMADGQIASDFVVVVARPRC
ncbi:hypothetical protein ABS71_12100 [bacterium SCN 62-11]|nr:class I SAM-dependent methyltransferase [Candidatus Eremiobacteraeota bacterium]ODT65632.1 MAG: hypothetical protein ABS71_12100 [bacterium SCN 62-11]